MLDWASKIFYDCSAPSLRMRRVIHLSWSTILILLEGFAPTRTMRAMQTRSKPREWARVCVTERSATQRALRGPSKPLGALLAWRDLSEHHTSSTIGRSAPALSEAHWFDCFAFECSIAVTKLGMEDKSVGYGLGSILVSGWLSGLGFPVWHRRILFAFLASRASRTIFTTPILHISLCILHQ